MQSGNRLGRTRTTSSTTDDSSEEENGEGGDQILLDIPRPSANCAPPQRSPDLRDIGPLKESIAEVKAISSNEKIEREEEANDCRLEDTPPMSNDDIMVELDGNPT